MTGEEHFGHDAEDCASGMKFAEGSMRPISARRTTNKFGK
jgi:hypothetical protein